MNKHLTLISVILLLSLTSCSTQNNTASSRRYHSMKTKYNIYFNGNTSFQEGLKTTQEAHIDNYADILPLYPQSDHQAAMAASSQMDKTIEKSRKCIKLHSIKKKPKIDPKKRNDPKYKEWLQHEEFNESIDEAWILLGMAEFHKGDFEGAIGTFNYIIKHFHYDNDVVAQCQLWIVRSYAELGWLYEAEDLLQKVNIEDLKRKNATLYAAAAADLKIKTQQYQDAIPLVKLRLPDEQRQGSRPRFQYVLAQLYEQTGDRQKAAIAYKKVSDMNPQWEMDFNARLHQTQLSDNAKASVKTLQKMAKNYKYKDKLDQIYGAIGNIYLQKKDTAEALRYFNQGIEEATQSNLEKAALLIQTADLYYNTRDYQHAQPYYSDAINIIDNTHKEYRRLNKRAEVLDLLVAEQNVVVLQDSLQRLSLLTEEEQLSVVQDIIKRLEEQERAEQEKAEQAERDAKNGGGGLRSVNTQNMLGGGSGSREWYFYNAQLMRSGQQQFQQKWGRRQLEDNWRRMNKASISLAETPQETTDSLSGDSIGNTILEQPKLVTDQHDPQYYLQQIPRTKNDYEQSDSLIATALYNMVYIYQDQLEDDQLAEETFQEFQRRFPQDQRLLNLYYSQYLNCLKHGDTTNIDIFRQHIMSHYPNSQEANVVSDPQYFERLQNMALIQDSLYEATYNAYSHNQLDSVKRNKQKAEEECPYSPLMPKFLFLNSIAVAKTEGQQAFVSSLKDLVTRYPESDVGAMAKDMLTLMNEGMESQTDGSVNSLTEKRLSSTDDIDSTLIDKTFSDDRLQSTEVLFIISAEEKQINTLLYEIALFNFSQFMIKDFDLKVFNPISFKEEKDIFNQTEQKVLAAVVVVGLESYDEGLWYLSLVENNQQLKQIIHDLDVNTLCITEENLQLVQQIYTLDEYRIFEKEQLHE